MNWLVPTVGAILTVGWLALLAAPLRYRTAWVLARTCAMLVAGVVSVWWFSHIPALIGIVTWPLGDGLLADAPPRDAATLAWFQLGSLTLFVGSWMVEDAPLHTIPHWVTAPLLLATALTGPIGWAAYMLVRDWHKWRAAKTRD